MRQVHLSRWLGWSSLAIGLALTLSACSSSGRSPARPTTPQPLLFTRDVFFDGAVVAEASLGPFRLAPQSGLNRTPPRPGEGEPIPVRDGRFGGRADRDAGGGFPRGFGEEGAFGGRETGPTSRRSAAGGQAAGLPRQALNVTLRSQAQEPLALRVVEIRSALGNFVPVPEQFTLAPGGIQELETMRAAYPGAIDELELLLSLRAAGRTETKVLRLRLPAAAR
jgi:hypothetical protein